MGLIVAKKSARAQCPNENINKKYDEQRVLFPEREWDGRAPHFALFNNVVGKLQFFIFITFLCKNSIKYAIFVLKMVKGCALALVFTILGPIECISTPF